ncbi:MAG: glycoside hydrolase TIM-barrel-like domain-containing protein [Alphaproteobacteria bacterium]|nr:glycoside hydrolase TIM-barrel-like domain-containing protein [Alphaproteobacteria bacterium]
MASILLSAAGTAVGASTGTPFGAALGRLVGRTAGSLIDSKLFGGSTKFSVRGSRLADLAVQSSAYGKMIPIVYGSVRLGGNIIWSQPIRETASTSTSSAGGGGKGGGGRVSQSTTSYSYSVTLAVAICEGEIDEIHRIWADAKQLDLSQYTTRRYMGSETQDADSLIASIEGADKTPAYRGMAYVVFEDFPLSDFGNRIPNFTFEIRKKSLAPDYNGDTLENEITGMVMIPGAGEFVYDTQVDTKISGAEVDGQWVQQGNQMKINMHNPTGAANALLALDQLQATCPNIEWVSVVASWFGDTMDAGTCLITPGVEFQADAIISPAEWSVAGFTRSTARLITQIDGAPQYGGTPDDASIVRFVEEIRSRGLKVAFYPLLFMDIIGKPWRGELTGSSADVADFFTKANGYNAFINHYVGLLAGKVDAFIIGSELKGLTSVTSTPGVYPAVSALVSLAGTVKTALGGSVTVTYAADWSEYHHTDDGWYNLDPLWASSSIDVVGIDAYFPLSNVQASLYDIDEIRDGWTSGEGYDFYYSDPERTTEVALDPEFAWKNIAWFYNNTHVNPDMSTTGWTAGMKKIWFTEVGYPSVDACTNQPNVFYDPSSSGRAFPYFSKGRVDIRAQRAALMATLEEWKGSSIVEQIFLWTWDARPFPYWPDLTSIWSDGAAWKTGHWVQGKLGISNVSAIVSDLCARAGLDETLIDVASVNIPVEGYVIGRQQSLRSCIEALQSAFFFDAAESDYILKFIPRGGESILTIEEDDLVMQERSGSNNSFTLRRMQEVELPKRVNVMYLSRLTGYQTATQYGERQVTESKDINTLDLPLVMSDQTAKNIADITLYTAWLSRVSFEFTLPPKYAALEPADVITVNASGVAHTMRILTMRLVSGGIEVSAVAEDIAAYDFYQIPGEGILADTDNATLPETELELLDIPALPGDNETQAFLRIAATGKSAGWNGAAIYRSDDDGANYTRLVDATSASAIGTASTALPSGTTAVFDDANSVTVLLIGNTSLQSVSALAVLNGANAALLGSEIIQFKNATLVGDNTYELSGLLRGRLGTEWAVGTHAAGERFVLLDSTLAKVSGSQQIVGLARSYKAVTYGGTLAAAPAEDYTYTGLGYKPYSPVHLTGTRDGGGNLTIGWVRRTRVGGGWMDGVDAPLSESSEAYEIDIMDGSDVVRTISTATTTASYSAASQTADFGSPQASIDVRITQLSAIVGRGTAGTATI